MIKMVLKAKSLYFWKIYKIDKSPMKTINKREETNHPYKKKRVCNHRHEKKCNNVINNSIAINLKIETIDKLLEK